MIIAIAIETAPGETRTSATPQTVGELVRMGHEVLVSAGAGQKSLIDDDQYRQSGATVTADEDELFRRAEVLLTVGPPPLEKAQLLDKGSVVIGMLNPSDPQGVLESLAAHGLTCFAMEAVPRIARAQSMDALSSQANIAGYASALVAVENLKKLVPLMMTAGGTIHPAGALVIGAGVAGLSAIATLKRLGALVKGIDTRPAAGEQVQSLGAKFVSMEVDQHQAQSQEGYARDLGEEFYKRQQEIIAPHLDKCDILICTAQIPNRRAPVLVTEEMLGRMNPGAVVVDLAATTGGNCSVTVPDEVRMVGTIKVLGPTNLPARLPVHASAMYARNVLAFLKELIGDGEVKMDPDNEIIQQMLVARDGKTIRKESDE